MIANVSWHPKKLFFYLFFTLALFFSWQWPPTRALWDFIDRLIFGLLNGSMRNLPWLQEIVGAFNLRSADFFFDAVMLTFVAYGVARSKDRPLHFAMCICMIVYIVIGLMILNKSIATETRWHHRLSPSLVVPDAVRLTKTLGWPRLKDNSHFSFPADHALSFMLWAALMARLFSRKIGIGAWIAAILFCLPRLTIGAHWLSDQLVGSGCLVLLSFACIFGTPLHDFLSLYITHLFRFVTTKCLRKQP